MFPFDIKLKKKLPISKFGSNYRSEILAFFENEFKERQADNLIIEENVLRFSNKLFKLVNNWNIMVPIDIGEISIQEESLNAMIIQYLFSLKRTLLIGAIAGLFFYIISKDWTFGIIAFLWLGGMNWLIAVIRHTIMFNNLIKKITKR